MCHYAHLQELLISGDPLPSSPAVPVLAVHRHQKEADIDVLHNDPALAQLPPALSLPCLVGAAPLQLQTALSFPFPAENSLSIVATSAVAPLCLGKILHLSATSGWSEDGWGQIDAFEHARSLTSRLSQSRVSLLHLADLP